MAASKPTSWLFMKFHLLKCTEHRFRDLRLRSGLFPFRLTELRPRSLTAVLLTNWYSEFVKKDEVSPCSFLPVALPPMGTHDANPKAVSERTSYYGIRLAFHPLPQVIR